MNKAVTVFWKIETRVPRKHALSGIGYWTVLEGGLHIETEKEALRLFKTAQEAGHEWPIRLVKVTEEVVPTHTTEK